MYTRKTSLTTRSHLTNTHPDSVDKLVNRSSLMRNFEESEVDNYHYTHTPRGITSFTSFTALQATDAQLASAREMLKDALPEYTDFSQSLLNSFAGKWCSPNDPTVCDTITITYVNPVISAIHGLTIDNVKWLAIPVAKKTLLIMEPQSQKIQTLSLPLDSVAGAAFPALMFGFNFKIRSGVTGVSSALISSTIDSEKTRLKELTSKISIRCNSAANCPSTPSSTINLTTCQNGKCAKPVPVDCVYSAWSTEKCPTACGTPSSTITRTRTIVSEAVNGGLKCSSTALSKTITCPKTKDCVPPTTNVVNCVPEDTWGDWEPCPTACGQPETTVSRHRGIKIQAANGGSDCTTLEETKQCPATAPCPTPNVDCVYSDWSTESCPTECGKTASEITNTRTVITLSSGDGEPCGNLTRTVSCPATAACTSTPTPPKEEEDNSNKIILIVGGVAVGIIVLLIVFLIIRYFMASKPKLSRPPNAMQGFASTNPYAQSFS